MTRLVVIGLDGGTDAVIGQPDAGMANIAALRNDGARATLRSTVPPITSAAWPTLFTGWNPGRHGLYDFRRLQIERYTRLWGAGQPAAFDEGAEFLTSARWAGSSLFDQAAAAGGVDVLGVPMTYPPWQVRGRLVAGFPLPDYGRNYTWPPQLAPDLPPVLEGADRLAEMSDAELAAHCRRLLERQRRIFRDWLVEGDAELVVAVFQATDFAQHRLWRYLNRPGHPLRDALLDLYRIVDEVVGEVRTVIGRDGNVVVVSDHGFGPHPRTVVHTDALLADAGLLALEGRRPTATPLARRVLRGAPGFRRRLRLSARRLPARAGGWLVDRYTGSGRVDWAATRAYRVPLYGAEGVVVNLRGRQSLGAVDETEYESVRDSVIDLFSDLRDPASGACVVTFARRREEVFRGAYVEDAPDVVILFEPGYKGGAGLDRLFAPVDPAVLERYSGVHAMDGIFAMAGSGILPGVDLGTRDIIDVAPTLLALLGLPVSSDADGRVMREALLSPNVAVQNAPAVVRDAPPPPALTPEEEAALARSLSSLGYLE
jgi:predicted AlkP superfamily phosphohydrolase/phosphomutase